MSFEDKVVIVTGASSGIGAVTAVQLTKEGAKVVLVGRNEAKLQNVAKDCKGASGKNPLVIIADVSKDKDAKNIVKKTIETYGKLDVLINNAAFGGKKDFLEDDIMEMYDAIMATNLRGLIYLTHLAVPHLIKSNGNIVNVSSVAALIPVYDSWAYCTSKAGLDHFSRCIALELASKGVRVNVVNPGPVKTDFLENAGFDPTQTDMIFEKILKNNALRRISVSREISDLIMFLASDKAKGVTGSNYVCDNGTLLTGTLPRFSKK